MRSQGVDFLLCPAFQGVAPTEGLGRYGGYTLVYNYLDLPAATFPTGLKVDQALDVVEAEYKPTNPVDEYEYSLCTLPLFLFSSHLL